MPSPGTRVRSAERPVPAPYMGMSRTAAVLVPPPPAEQHPTATLIGSVQRAMHLLESVAAHQHGAPAKQLARETGLALPTAYHLLRTLVFEGYLRREKGLFFLGEAAERLSSSGARQKRAARWWTHSRTGGTRSAYPCTTRCTATAKSRSCASPTLPATRRSRNGRDFRGQGTRTQSASVCSRSWTSRTAAEPSRPSPRTGGHPFTVRDSRLAAAPPRPDATHGTGQERQEYALGTVCAAIPITIGSAAATLAISLPSQQADDCYPRQSSCKAEVGKLPGSLAISISI